MQMNCKLSFVLLTVIYYSAIVWSSPAGLHLNQLQKDALTNLDNELKAKVSGEDFKSVLINWIKTLDEKVLRGLIDQMRNPSLSEIRRYSQPRKKPEYGSYEERIPLPKILKNLLRITEQPSSENLKKLLTAMKTPEGLAACTKLNIDEKTLNTVIENINGDASKQKKGKDAFVAILKSIPENNLIYLRDIYKIFLLYDLRQQLSDLIKKSTALQLTNMISILAKAERNFRFPGISFSAFSAKMKTDKERAEVVEEIIKWINRTDISDLRRVYQYFRTSYHPARTLRQVKALIGRKIDQKSVHQLTEFLQVLETAEGKTLLNKLSAKLTLTPEELLKKLNSRNRGEDIRVRRILKTWIYKLNMKDMRELQGSQKMFSEHHIRKDLTETVKISDKDTLIKFLSYLSQKESAGFKFENISFKEIKMKLDQGGDKMLDDVKKSFIEWLNKASLEQLSILKNVRLEKPRRTARKGAITMSSVRVNKDVKRSETTQYNTTAPLRKPFIKTTPITKLADIKTATTFQQFALKKDSSIALTPYNIKRALSRVITVGDRSDIGEIFTATSKGLNGYHVNTFKDGFFRVKMLKMSSRIGRTKSYVSWKLVRHDLAKWVSRWNKDQLGLFLVWYQRGVKI